MMYDKSFYNLISRPTRITNATATIIDNIYTNSVSFDKDTFAGVLTSDNIWPFYGILHVSDIWN